MWRLLGWFLIKSAISCGKRADSSEINLGEWLRYLDRCIRKILAQDKNKGTSVTSNNYDNYFAILKNTGEHSDHENMKLYGSS